VRKKRNTLQDRELERRKKLLEEVHRALAEEEKKRLRESHYMRCPKCAMELSEPIINAEETHRCGPLGSDAGPLKRR
jgi:hypothetical protein